MYAAAEEATGLGTPGWQLAQLILLQSMTLAFSLQMKHRGPPDCTFALTAIEIDRVTPALRSL